MRSMSSNAVIQMEVLINMQAKLTSCTLLDGDGETHLPLWPESSGMSCYSLEYKVVLAVVHAGRSHCSSSYRPNGRTFWRLCCPLAGAIRSSDRSAPSPSLWPKDVLVQNAVRALHQKDIHGLCEEEAIQTLLHGYCVICGKKLFSFQCTCEHVQKHHPEYVNELRPSYELSTMSSHRVPAAVPDASPCLMVLSA